MWQLHWATSARPGKWAYHQGHISLVVAMNLLQLSRRREGVSVAGEIDLFTAPELDECLSRSQADTGALIIDLGGVTFMDARGLTVLVRAVHRADGIGGGPPRLAAVTGQVSRLLRVTHLDRYLALYNDVEAAVSDVTPTAAAAQGPPGPELPSA
jgi:anti-anti-sigma factor